MKQATKLSALLGVYSLILYTADTSFSTMITKLYQQKHMDLMGPALLLVSYSSYIVSNLFISSVKLHYKYQLACAALFLSCQYAFSLFFQQFSQAMRYIIFLTLAVFAGMASSILTVAFGGYMHIVCKNNDAPNQEGYYYGVYTLIYSLQSITGALIVMFGFGLFNDTTYFIIITSLGITALLYCLIFVKNVQESNIQSCQENAQQQHPGILKAAIQVFKYYPNMKYLLGLIFIQGLTTAFNYTSLYQYIPVQQGQTDQQSNFKAGIAYLFNGLGGFAASYFGTMLNDGMSLRVSGNVVSFTFFLTMGCSFIGIYFVNFYYVLFLFFLWGIIIYYYQLWIFTCCQKVYNGKLESYAVYKQFYSVGFVIFQIIIIMFNNRISLLALCIIITVIGIPMVVCLQIFGSLNNFVKRDQTLNEEIKDDNKQQ